MSTRESFDNKTYPLPESNSYTDDWQKSLTIWPARLQHLRETNKLSDVCFLVGEPPKAQLVHAHKLILAAMSPVFQGMFYGLTLLEEMPIEVVDVAANVFADMLDYIYFNKFKVGSFDAAQEMMYAAEKYMLRQLFVLCTKYLLNNINDSNVCRIYEIGVLYNDSELRMRSLESIERNTKKVIDNCNFINVEYDTLLTILDLSGLTIPSEIDLVKFVLKYATVHDLLPKNLGGNSANGITSPAKNETRGDEVREAGDAGSLHKPKDIRDAFAKLRLLSLTPAEFATVANELKVILSQAEIIDYFIAISGANNLAPIPSGFCKIRERRHLNAFHNQATFHSPFFNGINVFNPTEAHG